MSSTRHAPEGAPLRQEKFASAGAYNMRLNAALVAKRCEILDEQETIRLLWFLQYASLSVRDGFSVRLGGVNRIAEQLLAQAPIAAEHRVIEQWNDGPKQRSAQFRDEVCTPEEVRAGLVPNLTTGLFSLALDPDWNQSCLAGLLNWREAITALRQRCSEQARKRLADTSVSSIAWDALQFTHDTGEPSLIIGDPRLGKSETAKVFCDTQAGTARYIEVPSSNDMRSLYKVVAEALGVADGNSYKAVQMKERIEEVARSAKIMLVFDEAQNLWTRNMRPRSAPERVQWINSLINMGVPIAFVALPEFVTWMSICSDQTGWSSKQLEQRITIHRRLPESLTKEDFATLTKHLAPGLSAAEVKFIVGCALEQDGAAFVKKVISAASYRAKKAGRQSPRFEDIQAAVRDDIMPSANTLRDALAAHQHRGRGRSRPTPAPAEPPPSAIPAASAPIREIAPRSAPVMPGQRTAPARIVQPACTA